MNSTLIILLLVAFSSPLPLLVIEKMLPYPFIVEELIKLFLVAMTIRTVGKKKQLALRLIILQGVLFSISESMFYLLNIIRMGDLSIFWMRIILSSPMHVTTMIVMYCLAKKGRGWLVGGFFIAMLLHLLYNLLI